MFESENQLLRQSEDFISLKDGEADEFFDRLLGQALNLLPSGVITFLSYQRDNVALLIFETRDS